MARNAKPRDVDGEATSRAGQARSVALAIENLLASQPGVQFAAEPGASDVQRLTSAFDALATQVDALPSCWT